MGRQVRMCGWGNEHWAHLGAKAEELSPGAFWIADSFPSAIPESHPIGTLDEAGRFAYLVRQNDLANLAIERVDSQAHWVVDGLRSPAIECFRGSMDGETPGRLYVSSGYWNNAERWVVADPALLRWYYQLARWVRASFIRSPVVGCYRPAEKST